MEAAIAEVALFAASHLLPAFDLSLLGLKLIGLLNLLDLKMSLAKSLYL